jgi:hypothetical protein
MFINDFQVIEAPNTGDRPEETIGLWRAVHLDSGREILRCEESDAWVDIHLPCAGRTVIQFSQRKDTLAYDMTCWELPQP